MGLGKTSFVMLHTHLFGSRDDMGWNQNQTELADIKLEILWDLSPTLFLQLAQEWKSLFHVSKQPLFHVSEINRLWNEMGGCVASASGELYDSVSETIMVFFDFLVSEEKNIRLYESVLYIIIRLWAYGADGDFISEN